MKYGKGLGLFITRIMSYGCEVDIKVRGTTKYLLTKLDKKLVIS